ncbi:MAG: hypothetical protein R3F49_23795 [Planctomycetota bacterium]
MRPIHLLQLAPALALLAPSQAQDAHAQLPAAPAPPSSTATGTVTQAGTGVTRSTVIFCDNLALPSSAVPGLGGASFASFDRPYGSPNGNYVLSADTDLPTSEDELVLLNGAVVAREGTSVDGVSAELVGLIDTKLGVNDNGDFVYATNTDGATTADEVIVAQVGGVTSVIAREGDPIPALPSTTYGTGNDASVITGSGVIGFSSGAIGGATTATDELLLLGNTVLLQQGVTVPSGQMASEFIEFVDFDDFHVSADGLHWIMQGDLTGDTAFDDVAIVDGAVVLQEGVIIPGSGFTDGIDSSGIVNVFMDAGGNWYARGNNDLTEQDWVVRNGVVIASVGAPIAAGTTEAWSDVPFPDCFFAHTGNGVGDYVIGGVTDAGVERDGVLVLNSSFVIAREGDPVDLDGNGLLDDDTYINTFGNDDVVLTDDLTFYVVATLKDGAGAAAGDVFLRFDLGDVVGTTFCDAQANSTGRPAFIGARGSVVAIDNDLTLAVCELPLASNGYFIVSPDQTVVVNPGNILGTICVGSTTMGRYANSVLSSGATGTVSMVVDLTAIPQPTGAVPVMSGATWNWQYWYRDMNPTATSNFSTAVSITFQ